jgi:hypothetical protein
LEAKGGGGGTALHCAAASNSVACIGALRAAGAALEAQSDTSATPLHIAAFYGRQDAAVCLIEAHANLEARTGAGSTPLMLAVTKGWLATAEAFVAAGANLEAANRDGDRPLHLAASEGHMAIVRRLIAAHADVQACNKKGETALLQAVIHRRWDAARLCLQAASGGAGPPVALPDDLQQQLCCPITYQLMRDPVTATDGHTYERAAIEGAQCRVGRRMCSVSGAAGVGSMPCAEFLPLPLPSAAWIAQGLAARRQPLSPFTNRPIDAAGLRPNHLVRGLIASLAERGLLG